MPKWLILDQRRASDPFGVLGLIPGMLDDDDPRPAAVQFDENYRHGGGWYPLPMRQCTAVSGRPFAFSFPGDPMFVPLAITKLRDEVICIYEGSFVGIWQRDGTFEIARMD